MSQKNKQTKKNNCVVKMSWKWICPGILGVLLIQKHIPWDQSLFLTTQGLFLINNKISKIHPRAFKNMDHLRLLYLSYNLLTEIPANLPPNAIEVRFHENKINRIQKDAFKGLRKLHVLGETNFSFRWCLDKQMNQ